MQSTSIASKKKKAATKLRITGAHTAQTPSCSGPSKKPNHSLYCRWFAGRSMHTMAQDPDEPRPNGFKCRSGADVDQVNFSCFGKKSHGSFVSPGLHGGSVSVIPSGSSQRVLRQLMPMLPLFEHMSVAQATHRLKGTTRVATASVRHRQ